MKKERFVLNVHNNLLSCAAAAEKLGLFKCNRDTKS